MPRYLRTVDIHPRIEVIKIMTYIKSLSYYPFKLATESPNTRSILYTNYGHLVVPEGDARLILYTNVEVD
jgi:hypothetical protein